MFVFKVLDKIKNETKLIQLTATLQAEEEKMFLEAAMGFRTLHLCLTCCGNLIPNCYKRLQYDFEFILLSPTFLI